MSSNKKLLQVTDTSGPSNVEDVFSVHTYKGTDADNNVQVNGIDLLNEGGLIWIKSRSNTSNHRLIDTVRGDRKLLSTNNSDAELTDQGATYGLNFNNNGFTVRQEYNGDINGNQDYVSWSFRKAPKFFDVVTYTGNGSNQTISHNLGTTVGCIIVKCTANTEDWSVYHRSYGGGYYFRIAPYGTDGVATNANYWNNTNATSTVFTVGSNSATNQSGQPYIAYLFAHDTTYEGIIQCGKYTGNGSTSSGPHINLGFEPQWLLIKSTANSTNWSISDTIRGLHYGNKINLLYPHLNDAEAEISSTPSQVAPTSTGFQIQASGTNFNTNGTDYIYVAIRKGPMATPTSRASVFAISSRGQNSPPPTFYANFPPDMFVNKSDGGTGNWNTYDRLRGNINVLFTDTDDVEQAFGGTASAFDQMKGIGSPTDTDTSQYSWMWRRSPGFFEVVAYTGTGSARTINHNLTVAPEMIWCKSRETVSSSNSWWVYHKNLPSPNDDAFTVDGNSDIASGNGALLWNSTAPTSTVFSLGTYNGLNQSGKNYIAYLWATLAGISKVGSFSHTNGSSTDVDCGFSSGSSLVWVRRFDTGINNDAVFYVWDSARGIVSGNDPYLALNSSQAAVTNTDLIDPLNSGFQIASGFTTGDYIFYAIAS